MSDDAAAVGPVPTLAVRSRPVAATESDAPSEVLVFAASERALAASGLAVAVGCGAALLGAGAGDAAAVDLSDTSELVLEADDVVAFTWAVTVALVEAVFGVTGAVASTVAANDGLPAAFALVGAAACFAGVAMASPAACTVALAMTAAVVVAAAAELAVAPVAATVAAEPSFSCAEMAPGAAAACELAAMAAAAMASGAELVGAEAVPATLAGATVTGIATAIAFCVVTAVAPSCRAGADGSVEEGVLEEFFPADFEVPAFVVSDLVMGWESDGWGASVLALELAALVEPVDGSVLVPRSLALFRGAVWLADEALREAPLSVDAETSLAGGCGAGAGKGAGSLPTSVAVLLSTSDAKLSFDCDGSGRAGFGGSV